MSLPYAEKSIMTSAGSKYLASGLLSRVVSDLCSPASLANTTADASVRSLHLGAETRSPVNGEHE